MPLIPATQEAEAGELPEPRRQRLRWAEMAPLHASLGNKSETPSQKKKKKKSVEGKVLTLFQKCAKYFVVIWQFQKHIRNYLKLSVVNEMDDW